MRGRGDALSEDLRSELATGEGDRAVAWFHKRFSAAEELTDARAIQLSGAELELNFQQKRTNNTSRLIHREKMPAKLNNAIAS
jgi:hypothetical protein